MTSAEMARSHLRLAGHILREAERLHAEGAWNLVVRRCREAVEMARKGLLRGSGVEVPHVHDVSGALRRNVERLPEPAAAEMDFLVSASRRLREEREIAFYGDEETGTEPEALFSRADADQALSTARRVLDLCRASGEGGSSSTPPAP